uniref:Uncharacterized protein n=1 Tax=Anguilla anguilla TaxID=7936 RepID=A0A0E9UER7_ANGAN
MGLHLFVCQDQSLIVIPVHCLNDISPHFSAYTIFRDHKLFVLAVSAQFPEQFLNMFQFWTVAWI